MRNSSKNHVVDYFWFVQSGHLSEREFSGFKFTLLSLFNSVFAQIILCLLSVVLFSLSL